MVLAASDDPMPYVLGDNPESMDSRVVVAARALRPMSIAPSPAPAGYLYLVTRPMGITGSSNQAALRSVLAQPFVVMILAVVALVHPARRLDHRHRHPPAQTPHRRRQPDQRQRPASARPGATRKKADVPWDLPDTQQPGRIRPARARHRRHAANPARSNGPPCTGWTTSAAKA